MCVLGSFTGKGDLFSQDAAQLPSRWDLQTCIDYALSNNIQIKQSEATKEGREVDAKLAKAALLPSLSASAGQNVGNYPFPSENEKSVTASANYNLNASWTVFDGGERATSIKQADLNNRIATLDVEESRNSIKLSIIQNYLQILYASEAIATYENAVELSRAQLESSRIKLEIRAVAKSDVSQWESQYAADKYNLVNAHATLDNYKLKLKQLLELDQLDSMNIVIAQPDEEDVLALLPGKQTIFQTAMNVMPQIKSSRLATEYAQLGIAKAKSGYYPTVSLQASSGTGNLYNHLSSSVANQLKYNWNNTVGLAVSIPIFSNRTVKSAVEKAGIEVESSRLNEVSIRKNLYSDIETAYLNAVTAQSQYVAADEKVKYSQEGYNVLNEQFTLGLKNTIELLTGKNTLISARQEMLQAKYTALLNKKILEYYQGLI